jgi:CBS domain-containing protein
MLKNAVPHDLDIRHFMSPSPHVIGPDATMAEALGRMRELGVRQLPVVEDPQSGMLFGIVSERDGLQLEAMGVALEQVPVRAAIRVDVCGVRADTPLDEVTAKMAEDRYGCAVVWSGSAVVGIFTMEDATRALAQLVRRWAR